MFTGIVEEIGKVTDVGRSGNVVRLAVESSVVLKTVEKGGSVCVSGACLTLTEKRKNILSFDVMAESMRKTSLGALRTGDRVNLEGAVRAGGSFGGHFVTGHVDCTGRIENISKGEETKFTIGFPRDFMKFVVEKGSVCVDGVSLTVGGIRSDTFDVYLIPHTLGATTLGSKKTGDVVNIESDIIGKYCARLIGKIPQSRVDETFLADNGF